MDLFPSLSLPPMKPSTTQHRRPFGISHLRDKAAPILLVAAAGLSTGCEIAVEGSGVIESRDYELDSFDTIFVTDGFDAQIIMADAFQVVVHADDNILDDIKVEQRGDAIKVYMDSHRRFVDITQEVQIFLPEVEEIQISDAVRLEADDMVADDTLTLSASDACDLEILAERRNLSKVRVKCRDASHCRVAAHAEERMVEAHDASDVDLQGDGKVLNATISDASSLDALKAEVERVSISVRDASNAKVSATDEVTGRVSNASELRVDGGAEIDVETSDASSVKRL